MAYVDAVYISIAAPDADLRQSPAFHPALFYDGCIGLLVEVAMQGHPEVVECLIKLLRGELAARDQYFLHSRYYEDFGLTHLYTRINHEMEEETQHADDILRRILFLEGTPDMRPDEIEPGTTVTEMLRKDLALEYSVQKNLTPWMTLVPATAP